MDQAALTLGLSDSPSPLGLRDHHFCFTEEETEAQREPQLARLGRDRTGAQAV